MTLDDLERQNRGFMNFFLAIFGCHTHFKSELRRNHEKQTGTACIWSFQY